jgi:hypothetical protein
MTSDNAYQDPHHWRIKYVHHRICDVVDVVTDLVESSVEGAPGLPDAILPDLLPYVLMGGGRQVTLLLVRLLQVARVLRPELLVQRARDQTPGQREECFTFKAASRIRNWNLRGHWVRIIKIDRQRERLS